MIWSLRFDGRQALGHAERIELVGRNVAKLALPPRIPRREIRPLSPEQARTFLGAIADDRLEALYLIAIGVGLRQGEILGLRWSDVDLAAGTIEVRFALQVLGSNPSVGSSPQAPSTRRDARRTSVRRWASDRDAYRMRGAVSWWRA